MIEENKTTFDEIDLVMADENKLPEIFTERLKLLENTNMVYDLAKKKEKDVREKVDKALKRTNKLIAKAKDTGINTSESHSFLWFKWTTKKSEIETLKKHGRNNLLWYRKRRNSKNTCRSPRNVT